MSRRRVAIAASAASFLMLAVSIVLAVLGHTQDDGRLTESPYEASTGLLVSFLFITVGSLLAIRRHENVIGLVLLLTGTGGGGLIFNAYGTYALVAKPDSGLPAASAAAMLDTVSIGPFLFGVVLLLLLFPGGRIESRQWRMALNFVAVSFGFAMLTWFLTPGEIGIPYDYYENPFGVEAIKKVEFLGIIFFPVIPISVIGAIINLFVRFRRSVGEEREQFRWLAFSALTLIVLMPLNAVFSILGGGLAGPTLFLPIAIGIAVFKYRLYDIDKILNRAIVYGLLTALLAAIYFGLVVGLQAATKPLAGSSDLAIALTTLIVAALFLPARQRVQALVDRRFNRRAYDAAQTLDAFSARLRQNIDLDTLRYELLAVVDETMEPRHVSLWLRPTEALR